MLSVEQRDPLDPIWLADAQFARTFLIPLLLNARTGYPVHELFLFHRDGMTPSQALRYLPGPIAEVTEQDWKIPVRDGSEITTRVYKPVTRQEGGRPLIVMFHEGA